MNKELKALMGNKTEEFITVCKEVYATKMYSKCHYREADKMCEELFTKLCHLAKFKHCRIDWCGIGTVCQPDKFIIYKNGKAYIFNIDGLMHTNNTVMCYSI